MATVRDVITDALLELTVVAAGETPTADDASLGLRALNRLVDAWAGERLMIYTITRTTEPIVSNTGTYTVGSGGDIDVARPVFIDHVNYQDTSTSPDTEYQMQPLTDDAWSKVVQKGLTSPMPTSWYYNPTYPLGTLDLWPVPTLSTLEVVVYAPAAVAEFTSLSQTISLPPGYRRMLVKNLAIEMSPSFGRQIDPMLVQQAMQSKESVKRENTRLLDMSFEASALIQGRNTVVYDIRTGP